MRAYYGSRFSPNKTATPEGFLICHNVPVARTGWYEYLAEEIGAEEKAGTIVQVYRSPEEVFSPGAIASFEGKVLTDEHPPDLVTPDNATRYAKGVIQNVRQGSGSESDLLIADLVVYDQLLIDEIQQGKREVSAGYECTYVLLDSGGPSQQSYQQKQICGNHVAVVKSGRAGDRVAIKDAKHQPNLELEGETRMSKKIALPKKKQFRMTDFLAAVGLKQFALDAEPEDIREAVDAMAEERVADDADIAAATPAPAEPAKDQDPAIAALTAQVEKLTALVTQALQGQAKPAAPGDAIDDAIAELEKAAAPAADDNEEESHTIPAESMDDEGPVAPAEDRPEKITAGDTAYKIAALKAMKPILAQIADPTQRKLAADAAIRSIKGMPAKNTYAEIKPKKPATDGKAPAAAPDHSQLGRNIAKKHNPHYKDRA